MKKILFIIAGLMSSGVVAQKEDIAAFIGGNFQQVSSKKLFGGQIGVRYYFTDNFSFGGEFNFASQKYRENFNYFTDRTQLQSFTFNLASQYDIFKDKNFTAGIFVNNGVKSVTLRNLNDTYWETHYDEDGYPYYVETPKKLNNDVFYVLTPGVDLSVKLATVDEVDNVGLYLTGRAGYEMGFGKDFLQRSSNPQHVIASVGITLKGSTKSRE